MTSHPLSDSDLFHHLFRGELAAVFFDESGKPAIKEPVPSTVLSGSFNPVHAAHWKLAEIAMHKTGRAAVFELSIVNVDKPSLCEQELCRRLQQFSARASVWVTRAPTFAEKAKLFPESTFVIGADTAERLLLPRYYGNDGGRMLEALAFIQSQGCNFLVAGRVTSQGRFCCLGDIPIPEGYCDMFTAIPREEFDHEISSSQLRQR